MKWNLLTCLVCCDIVASTTFGMESGCFGFVRSVLVLGRASSSSELKSPSSGIGVGAKWTMKSRSLALWNIVMFSKQDILVLE